MRRSSSPIMSPTVSPMRHAGEIGAAGLALLAAIWGYGWVMGKIGLRYSPPFTFAALRTVMSAAGMLLLLLVLRRPLRPPHLGYTAVLGLLQTTGYVCLSVWALAHANAGKTGVLTYTMPFWLLLLAWPLLGERLRGWQWPAVALAFTGLVLVLSPWHLHGVLAGALTVAAGFCWAASAVVVKLLQRHETVDVLSLTTWQMIVGAVPVVVVAALTYDEPPRWTGVFIGSLAYNVLLANGLGWILWLCVLKRLPAGTAGIGTLAVPVIGVLAAWLQLGEQPGAVEATGMACIVGALAMITVYGITGGAASRRGAAESLEVEAEELPHT